MIHVISSFTKEYSFLSNFYPSPVKWMTEVYPTVEHAYQAIKTIDLEQREQIRTASTPGIAKRMGKRVTLRENWDDIKLDVMLKLLRRKFQDPILKAKLLATDNAELIEGNYWGDTYWGVCGGVGENNLGKLLMGVRGEIA